MVYKNILKAPGRRPDSGDFGGFGGGDFGWGGDGAVVGHCRGDGDGDDCREKHHAKGDNRSGLLGFVSPVLGCVHDRFGFSEMLSILPAESPVCENVKIKFLLITFF